jgi:hypothetical protein
MKTKVTEAEHGKRNWLTGRSKAEIAKAMRQKYAKVRQKQQ